LFCEPLPKLYFVSLGRFVLFLGQRDQEFAIGARNGGNVTLRQTGPAVGDADIVDDRVDLIGGNLRTDLALETGEANFGLLDTRPRRTASMQAHLAGIHVGEEVL